MPLLSTRGAASARGFGLFGRVKALADPFFNYVTMLLHGDGTNGAQNNTFLDSSTNNFTITRNGNTTQGSFSPYGPNWSNYFNGSSTIVTPTSTALSFGTGDFSVEAWINYTAGSWLISNYTQLASPGDYGTLIGWNGGNIQARIKSDNANEFTLTSSVQATAQTWNHVAFVRTGTTVSLYLNGVRVATGTSSISSVTNQFRVGGIYVNSSTVDFTGYVSNLRVCKGTTPYLASATSISVSTQPLTAVSGTSLLTCADNRFIDDSTNNFTITRNGDVSVQRFSPFAPPAAYNPATIGGSGYFDGSGDWLNYTGSSISTSVDFTFSIWFYSIGAMSANKGIFGASNARFGMLAESGNNLYILASTDINTSTPIPINQWNHLAITRTSGTLRAFLNGTQVGGTASNSQSLDSFRIGNNQGGEVISNCYMSDARVLVGTGGTSVSVPTAPQTAITNTNFLCNFTNGAIFDSAMMNDLETVGNAQISTSVVKYGTGSLAFDGDSDSLKYLTNPLSDLGGGDFTIEFWINANTWSATTSYSIANLLGPINVGYGLSGAFAITSDPTFANGVNLYNWGGPSGDGIVVNIPLSSLTTGVWYHMAFCKASGTTRAFLNGTSVSSSTKTYTGNFGSNPLYIGGGPSNAWFNGYIDDMRITKGVARYTANFTPPTAAFPNQ